MARRKGFFRRLVDLVTGRQEPKRRATTRETRQFSRGRESPSRVAEQYAKDRRDAEETRLARDRERRRQQRERREREQEPYRRIWRGERGSGAGRAYMSHWRVFNTIPGVDDLPEDEKRDLWASYVHNMVEGRGYRYNSVTDNPFWSDIGIDPYDFQWAEWRAAMGYKAKSK